MRLIAAYLALAAAPAFAAGMSEDQAVDRGLAQPRVATMIEARRAAAEGVASSLGRWENPELEYSEERLDLPGTDVKEQFLWLRQRFNVAGARGLERRAAREGLEGEYASIEIKRRVLAQEIRSLYYDVVAARERFDALKGWRERLKELVAAVEARQRAGDAARYDSVRLRQELSLINARALEAEAGFESARQTLFALIDAQPVELTGLLLPPAAPSTAPALAGHPTLLALEAQANSADSRAKAANRDAWPDVTLGIGRRELAQEDRDADGGLIAIGVELPLFNRSQGEAQAAKNEATALRAEASLLHSRLQASATEARRLLEVRRAATLDLTREASNDRDSLSTMAEAAYAAGEIDVMALIDAHRTELAMAIEAVSLARAARTAYIQLQYLSGVP